MASNRTSELRDMSDDELATRLAEAREAMNRAIQKLPIKAKIIVRAEEI